MFSGRTFLLNQFSLDLPNRDYTGYLLLATAIDQENTAIHTAVTAIDCSSKWTKFPRYHETIWHGGTVYVEDDFPNLLFAKDGEIYDLDGKEAIVIGGAYSVDKYYRLQRGMNWFPDEQPSDEIKQQTENQLSAINWNVDIVLTHTCPQKYVPIEAFLPGLDQSMVDHSTEEWLDKIEDRLNYKDWFCDHWHIDKRIDKMHFMMRSVEAL